ncbi:MAG: glycerol-3-phosphate 1-O-acyltransferase PlsY [Bacillota bacterium]
MKILGLALLAYVIGSVPTGYLLARHKGVDIFRAGSGNIGATNVWRTLGPFFGTLALAGDVGKGAVAVYLGSKAGHWHAVIAGASVLAGHSWSLFLRFRGGKMIATALGVFLMLTPAAAVGAFAVWGVVLALSRYVSLASIIAAASLPVFIAVFSYPWSYVFFAALTAAVAIYKHRSNIRRLLDGTEHRLRVK